MYTALLVDDEPIILEALVAAFHWNQFGINTVLTAHDGNSALEIMSRQNVNLLITDIYMPNMDGLELLKQVRTFHPDTHCIILTSYNDFEYARTALQLGIENYLLKPIVIKELIETIENTLNNIYTNKKISQQLFRNNLLQRWVTGSISGEELSEHCSLLDINLYLPEYCILCIHKRDESVSLSAFCRICEEQLKSTYNIHVFKDSYHRYVFIIGSSHIHSEQLISVFKQQAEEMNLAHFIELSLGDIVKNADNLVESYRSACRPSKTLDLFTPETLMLSSSKKQQIDFDQLLYKMSTLFHQDDEILFQDHLHKLADELYFMAKAGTVLSIQTLLTQTIEQIFLQNFSAQPETREKLHNYIHPLPTASNRNAFTIAIMDLLNNSYFLYRYYFKQFSPVVQLAIQYIHKHFAENISIHDFCNKRKITPAYLGYLFRTETGEFLNNYLTQYRLHCSIHLLTDTSLTINDIAQKVGFSYSSYYISCFKKQFGVSPNKYRIYYLKE